MGVKRGDKKLFINLFVNLLIYFKYHFDEKNKNFYYPIINDRKDRIVKLKLYFFY